MAGVTWPSLDQTLASLGCTFTVLVHTREAATRNMEKIQVIKVRGDPSGGQGDSREALKARCHSSEWAGVLLFAHPQHRWWRCLARGRFLSCVNCVAECWSLPSLGTQY